MSCWGATAAAGAATWSHLLFEGGGPLLFPRVLLPVVSAWCRDDSSSSSSTLVVAKLLLRWRRRRWWHWERGLRLPPPTATVAAAGVSTPLPRRCRSVVTVRLSTACHPRVLSMQR
ncbi:unnamed protein product, partial [Ectocarpus sp. 8 AP-2014]